MYEGKIPITKRKTYAAMVTGKYKYRRQIVLDNAIDNKSRKSNNVFEGVWGAHLAGEQGQWNFEFCKIW